MAKKTIKKPKVKLTSKNVMEEYKEGELQRGNKPVKSRKEALKIKKQLAKKKNIPQD
jgi:hypothetical protein